MSQEAAAPSSAGTAVPARAREAQDPLNRYLYHPLAARLARLLVPTGVSPNAVSVMSGGMICAAAWFYGTATGTAGVLASGGAAFSGTFAGASAGAS